MIIEEILQLDPFYTPVFKKNELLLHNLKQLCKQHLENCQEYKSIINSLSLDLDHIKSLDQIPFLPVGLFKEYDLKSINKSEVNSDFSIGCIGQKLITWKDIENNNTAFVDGSLYSGSVSMLKEKGFMPEAKTLAFPLSIDNSIDIDTEEEFKDALLLIKKLKELGIEYVKPRI